MKPNTESITAAASAMPKDRRRDASTRGVEIAVQKPSKPSSNGPDHQRQQRDQHDAASDRTA